MKRLLSIFRRDVQSGVREFLLLYIILAPIVITIGLRFFIPSVNAISLQFALESSADNTVVQEFERYGRVELMSGRAAIENRVNKVDDIVGVLQKNDGSFIVITQGNEKHSAKLAVYQILDSIKSPKPNQAVSFSDIGAKISQVAVYGASSVVLMAILLGGMVIGLNIIEEKESRTISALSVTPMRRLEFIAGKSITGFLLPVVEALAIVWILGLRDINISMLLVMTLSSSIITVIFGFIMGVMSSNQITGIANMKFLLIFVSASFIGAVALPPEKHFFLYWSPLYWSTIGLIQVISNTATWMQIMQYTLWIAALTAMVFILCKGRIRKGLT